MATGYAAAVSGASDFAKVYPKYTVFLGAMSLADAIIASAYTSIYRQVLKRCTAEGRPIAEIADGDVFILAEVYLGLALIFEANIDVSSRGVVDALSVANHWRKQYENEMSAVAWSYDDSVSGTTDTEVYTEYSYEWEAG